MWEVHTGIHRFAAHSRPAKVEGEVLIDGEDVLGMTFGRLRALRWGEASIVFQGALHSLNPVQRIGTQIAEPIFVHDKSATQQSANSGWLNCSTR